MVTLITGASGHIGGNLVRALVEQRRKIRVIVHEDERALEGLKLERMRGDILDPQFIDEALRNVDTVFHAAAHISIQSDDKKLTRNTNVNGTKNILYACFKNRVKRYIHYSSIHAFNPLPLEGAIDEMRPLRDGKFHAAYDMSKAEAEREVMLAHENGLNTVILSPTAVIGPHDFKPSLTGAFFIKMVKHQIPVILNAGFNWVDVRDVIAGSLAAEKMAAPGSKYILSGHWAFHREIADYVAEITGKRAPAVTLPLWAARAAAPVICGFTKLVGKRQLCTATAVRTLREYRYISNERAKKELGYTPMPLRETLRDTFRWYHEAGMVSISKK